MKKYDYAETHFQRQMATARMGFRTVPMVVEHEIYGRGTLAMDGNGLHFESFKGEKKFDLSWEQFDKGPPK